VNLKTTSDLWWKNAVVYCLDVETFFDSDGDGCGDFKGLTQRLDYLSGIGVSCVWLMPFYPSPRLDDGYDITDFFGVDPRLGTLGDFAEFIRTARDRGIRVIADLVMNHTSDQHPWFQSARSSPDSPYRNFYVWSEEKPEEKPGDVVFPDKENSNWQWDAKARAYYLHRFYSHQPDLNVANPEVRDEIAQVVGFWLQQGLSGFRVDAVPFMLEPIGMPRARWPIPTSSCVTCAPTWGGARGRDPARRGQPAVRGRPSFYGDEGGDELHMLFDFIGNQALYLSMARGEAAPLVKALRDAPAIPPDCQWGASCATTTSSRSTSSPTTSARRSSPPSGPTSRCSSSAAACAGGCHRCSGAIPPRCGWSTRSPSRCRGPPCSSTGRRSGWGRTSRSRGA
jgi:maltose alpha-D-glucosyltransferase/alpha-amylase